MDEDIMRIAIERETLRQLDGLSRVSVAVASPPGLSPVLECSAGVAARLLASTLPGPAYVADTISMDTDGGAVVDLSRLPAEGEG